MVPGLRLLQSRLRRRAHQQPLHPPQRPLEHGGQPVTPPPAPAPLPPWEETLDEIKAWDRHWFDQDYDNDNEE
ncbi:hypothetical protein GCM10010221_45560 [Streptomyces parvus]|nr:hypothetical protein GCM10010221_45560 [Streptomyces parvus]